MFYIRNSEVFFRRIIGGMWNDRSVMGFFKNNFFILFWMFEKMNSSGYPKRLFILFIFYIQLLIF